jgi:hypothetical protein
LGSEAVTVQTPGRAPAARGTQTQVLLGAGAQEAWRLVRHPIHIAGWLLYALYLWTSLSNPCRYGPPCFFWTGEQFTGIPRYIVWLAGVPTYAAASLLATRPRRTGTAEWLSSLPTGPETRWAISLMAALGPFAVSVLAAGLAWCYVWTHDPGIAPRLPSFSEYAAAPVAVLGGGLLAVLVARWFPWPLVPVVVIVGIIQAVNKTETMQANDYTRATWFTPYANTLFNGGEPGSLNGIFLGFVPGSMPWHLTYLIGLDLLIIVGVFLVGRHHWYAAAAAIPVLALIAVAGVRQLSSGDEHSIVFTVGVASAAEPTRPHCGQPSLRVSGPPSRMAMFRSSTKASQSQVAAGPPKTGHDHNLGDPPTGSRLAPTRPHDAYFLRLGDTAQSRRVTK